MNKPAARPDLATARLAALSVRLRFSSKPRAARFGFFMTCPELHVLDPPPTG
jgi:hypothetical protein